MPWLIPGEPAQPGDKALHLAIKAGFQKLLSAEEILPPLRQIKAQYSITPEVAARVLLAFRTRKSGADSSQLFLYAEKMLDLRLLDVRSLLIALLATSRFSKHWDFTTDELTSTAFGMCEERMFLMLNRKYATGTLAIERFDLHGLVYSLSRWMHVITDHEMDKHLQHGPLAAVDVGSFNMYEALATLVSTVVRNPAFAKAAKQTWWKKRRPIIVTEIQNFDANVLQWVQSQWARRLDFLTNFPPFIETDESGKPVFTDAQIMMAIEDLPVSLSRAGLYIWLNACLYSRPYTDDAGMMMYLQARYGGNVQSMVVDLLAASFDTLTNAFRRQESEQSVKIVRSFLCNKVPTLLSFISGGVAPAATVEACVQVAFANITMDPLPPITNGATEVREKLKLSRLECLQACILHGIVTEATTTAILQEPAPSLKVHKYTKEGLSAKYANNIGAVEPLIDELDNMHGNAGAIAGFIVDALGTLCVNSDTITLKLLCNMLVKKMSRADIIMQYTSAAHLLLPLCNQLNNWTHDQDQEEFTPEYEEFASILLFVLAVVHRYGLTASDIGLQSDDTFVSTLLRMTPNSQVLSTLTAEQNMQLSKWIEGLYAPDESGETGGIRDEVMRPCPPQAFYQLVPTLISQSVTACKHGILSLKALKGGVELLVMPFLLPSLVPALNWVVKHLWEDHSDADILIQVLDKLLRPSSSSPETKAMHKTIFGIVADPLYQSLQTLAQKKPGKKEITALLEILKPRLGQNRLANSSKSELEGWIATPDGGIARCLRRAIRDQVAWVTNVGPTPPPVYTHHLYKTACEIIGVDAVLDAIIDELKEQTTTSLTNGSYTIDICTAIICAPTPGTPNSGVVFPATGVQPASGAATVREALRLRTANPQTLLSKPEAEAESLVRLARRVDAQLVVSQLPQLVNLPLPLQPQAADQIMADLGLTDENMDSVAQDAAAATAVLDPTSAAAAGFDNAQFAAVMGQTLDMNDPGVQQLANLAAAAAAAGESADPTMGGMEGVQQQDQSGQEQDIFGLANMDMNVGVARELSQMGGQDVGSTASGAGGIGGIGVEGGAQGDANAEDDIFAGLDMSNMDDEFNFS